MTLADRATAELRPGCPMPRQIGSWWLDRLIGEGYWTGVYRARPIGAAPDGPFDYAVKLARAPDVAERAVALMAREVAVTREVSHPRLVPVLASRIREEPCYLVMPRISGVPVSRLIQRVGPIPAARTVWIARQIAEALAALHGAGWLHGDVKPDNILVADTGQATLLDLGFARRLDSDECRAGSPLYGSPAYAAPERLSPHTCSTARSDIFSLGITMFEMLTGRLPDPPSKSAPIANFSPHDPRRHCPTVPSHVARLVRDLCAGEPLRRPDALELITRLVLLEIETIPTLAATE